MGLAFCVKYLAFYSCCLCFALFARDFWLHRLPNRKLSHFQLFLEYSIQSVSLVTVPILIYLAVFYAHFAMLTKAGTHDFMMTRSGHQLNHFLLDFSKRKSLICPLVLVSV